MNRNDALFLVIGLLVGFIAGYLMQEVMADRQPPRLVHGEGGTTAAAPAPPPAAGPGGPPTQQSQQTQQALLQEVQSLEAFVQANPQDADALLRLANLSFDVESWSRCVEMFERYLELRPETPDLLSDLGVCYRGVGQLDRALATFDRAHEIEPDHWQSRFNEAVVLGLDQRNYEAADEVVEELRALQPGNPQVERLAEEIARRRDGAA